jgi:hypothetical protein
VSSYYSSPSSRFSCEQRFQLSPATPSQNSATFAGYSLAPLRLDKTLSGVATASPRSANPLPFPSPVSLHHSASVSSLFLDEDDDSDAFWYCSVSSRDLVASSSSSASSAAPSTASSPWLGSSASPHREPALAQWPEEQTPVDQCVPRISEESHTVLGLPY